MPDLPPPDASTPTAPPGVPTGRRTWPAALVGALVGAGLVLAAVGVWWRVAGPRVTEETVQTAAWTAIQRESPDQFLVVGRLDVGTETEATSTTRLLPGVLDLNVGQTVARVRVPGRAAYGFDLGRLRPQDIRYTPDGVVIVTLPPLAVFSAEPVLEEAEVSVDAERWQRLSREPERAAVRAALGRLRPAIRAQAEAHLADSDQPARNAALAVERLIATPLAAAGVRDARFRFVVAPGDTLEGQGGDR